MNTSTSSQTALPQPNAEPPQAAPSLPPPTSEPSALARQAVENIRHTGARIEVHMRGKWRGRLEMTDEEVCFVNDKLAGIVQEAIDQAVQEAVQALRE